MAAVIPLQGCFSLNMLQIKFNLVFSFLWIVVYVFKVMNRALLRSELCAGSVTVMGFLTEVMKKNRGKA